MNHVLLLFLMIHICYLSATATPTFGSIRGVAPPRRVPRGVSLREVSPSGKCTPSEECPPSRSVPLREEPLKEVSPQRSVPLGAEECLPAGC